MSLTSIIKIIKINDERTGIKNDRQWVMQDCECILLDDSGEETQVGVLMLPKHLRGKNEDGTSRVPPRGTYIAAFALQASMKDRRIEAVLTDLKPYPLRGAPGASSPAAVKSGA